MTPAFHEYSRQVKRNAAALGTKLISFGYTLATGGTDNHLILWDLKPQKVTGSKFEKTCDAANITLNKNCVPGDRSAVTPGGVRIGAPALTTRKMCENEFEQIAEFLHEVLEAALKIQEKSGPKLKDFAALLDDDETLKSIRDRVNKFATSFPMPGFDPKAIKYQDYAGPSSH